MAGILGGQLIHPLACKVANPDLSTDINTLVEGAYPYGIHVVKNLKVANANFQTRIATPNNQGILGYKVVNFFDDYYNRIHVSPNPLKLGTIGAFIRQPLFAWNAFTKSTKVLTSINITGDPTITIDGATAYTFKPNEEVTYYVGASPKGPPEVLGLIAFNFVSNSPLPVTVTGNRATIIEMIPETPITETWEWLTSIMVAVDGTEQRVCLRNKPRKGLDLEYVGLGANEVREQHKFLLNAKGRVLLPYMQWATITTASALLGASAIYFKTGLCDVRSNDYILLIQRNAPSLLVQVVNVFADYVTILNPLSMDISANSIVVTCFPSLIDNNASLKRNLIDSDARFSLSTSCLDIRQNFVRPGSTASLTTLNGFPILNRRPVGMKDQDFSIDTGQEIIDNKTGNLELFSLWDSIKESVSLKFVVHRTSFSSCGLTGIEEMDYWRLFFDTIKGAFKGFLLPSYRNDLPLASAPVLNADSMVIQGTGYANTYFPVNGYNYLAITSSLGVHYTKVLSASVNLDGDSTITFSPALPTGYEDVEYVSFLRQCRLANDKVTLEHDSLDTTFNLKVRTVKQ